MTVIQDPPIITGPWPPRQAETAVLAVLAAAGPYPDICRRGIWHCPMQACGCPVGDRCDCTRPAVPDPTTIHIAPTTGATR